MACRGVNAEDDLRGAREGLGHRCDKCRRILNTQTAASRSWQCGDGTMRSRMERKVVSKGVSLHRTAMHDRRQQNTNRSRALAQIIIGF